MSTIFDRPSPAKELARRAVRTTATAAGILLVWFTATVIITLLPGAAPVAMIVLPTQRLMNALPEEAYVLDWSGATAKMTGGSPSYVRKLYEAGAFLVLPARKSGCLANRKQTQS